MSYVPMAGLLHTDVTTICPLLFVVSVRYPVPVMSLSAFPSVQLSLFCTMYTRTSCAADVMLSLVTYTVSLS